MRGFTIVELVIAMTLTVVVMGVTLSFIGRAHDTFQVQPEFADSQQRVRVGIDSLQRDLLMAGAGMYAGGAVGPLNHAIAPIMPYRAFGNTADPRRGLYFRMDTISLIHVPSTPSQTTLAAPLLSGALELDLNSPPNCPRSTLSQVCAFEAGDPLLVFDTAGYWDVFEVESVDPAADRLRRNSGDPALAFDVNASVAEARAVTYSLKADPQSAAYQLVRAEGSGPELPLVDHVVKLEFQYFGDPEPPRLVDEESVESPELHATYGAAPPPVGESRGAWPPGESCTFALVDGRHQPRLDVLGAGSGLVEITPALLTDGPWCADADTRNRFDADLLRIRRVRFTLRVQTALASLRGPVGALFARGGTARAGGRYVPDIEIQLDATPRNLSLAR